MEEFLQQEPEPEEKPFEVQTQLKVNILITWYEKFMFQILVCVHFEAFDCFRVHGGYFPLGYFVTECEVYTSSSPSMRGKGAFYQKVYISSAS